GSHTVYLQATDLASNVSNLASIPLTLDTVPPTITLTSPASGVSTDQNITITGLVSDDRTGVASLQAAVDSGAFAPVTFDAAGAFNFTTALAVDGTANGSHTVHFGATDNAGNIAPLSDLAFTLQKVRPLTTTTSPAAGLVTNANITITGQATDAAFGITEIDAAVDGGDFTSIAFDASGNFIFPTALAVDGTAD